MSAFLCQNTIDFDALEGYQAEDIQRLIAQVKQASPSTVVLLRNAHYLTAKAFAILYRYIQQELSDNVIFILVSSDQSKIFPPLLECVQLAS